MTLLMWALFSPSAMAVDVCRGAEVQTDRVSGVQSMRMTESELVLDVTDGVATVTAPASLPGLVDVVVPAGTELLLVLEDGTKVTFRTSAPVTPKGTAWASQYAAGVFTTWTLAWSVSAEAAHAVASSRPVALRYTLADHPFAVDYTTAVGTKRQRLYACAANQALAE